MKLWRLGPTTLLATLSLAAVAAADPSISITVGGQPAGSQVNVQSLNDLQVLVTTPDGATATTSIDLQGGTQGQVPIDQRAAPVNLSAPIAASISSGASNFAITRDTCTGTALGSASGQNSNCIIEVTPKANTFGLLGGSLRLSVGDYQKEVPLTGNAHDFEPAKLTIAAITGNPSLMAITGPGRPAYSSTVVLRITNSSSEKISTPVGIVLSGSNTANFEVTADACTGKALAPRSSCDISVRSLASQPISNFSATLTAAANNNPQINLAGSAAGWKPPALAFVGTDGTGVNVQGPGAPAYGQPIAFTVQNTGDLVSGAVSATLLSSANFEFSGTNTCVGATLDAAQSCIVSVRAKATANGTFSTTLRVAQSGVTTDLTISGIASKFNPAKLILASGSGNGIDIPNGASPGGCRDFGFRNDGDLLSGTINSSVTSGAENFSTTGCTNTCANSTLNGGQTCSVGVRLVASANSTFSGNLRLTASPGGTIDVPLSGAASGFCTPVTQRTGESACSASCGGGQKTVYWSNGCGSTWTSQESCNTTACTPPPSGSLTINGVAGGPADWAPAHVDGLRAPDYAWTCNNCTSSQALKVWWWNCPGGLGSGSDMSWWANASSGTSGVMSHCGGEGCDRRGCLFKLQKTWWGPGGETTVEGWWKFD